MNGLLQLILFAFKCVMFHVVKNDDVEERKDERREKRCDQILIQRKRKEGKEKENVSESITKNIEMISSLF